MAAGGWVGRRGRELGVTANGYEVSLGSEENVLELGSDDGHNSMNILKTTALYTSKG